MLEAAEVVGRFGRKLMDMLQHVENDHAKIRDLARELLASAEGAVEEYARVRISMEEALKYWPDAEQSARARGH
jgi:hypothetical protein